MMYKDDIDRLNGWFEANNSYLTYHTNDGIDDEYSINANDVDKFSDFLRLNYPDLIGIPCMVNDSGIFFRREDLDKARFY